MTQGRYSFFNFFRKLLKIFVSLGLSILRVLRLKFLLKQISLEDDVTCNKNIKIPIFNL